MIVPFKAEHLKMLQLQDMQQSMSSNIMNQEYGKNLEKFYAYSLIIEDQLICCAGIVQIWENRSIAWALISKNAGKHFFEIHKNVRAAINLCTDRRLEITVDSKFEQAKRWAKMLGFKYEGTMLSYGIDGSDHDLYSRIRK